MKRELLSSGAPWEPIVGYSRAVSVGDAIWIAGTTATGPDGHIVGETDAYAQTVQALKNISAALERLGSSTADVVRTRMFVTDISQWEAVARAHGEVFGTVRPAATLVQVVALVDPAMLVEIEVDAVRGSGGRG